MYFITYSEEYRKLAHAPIDAAWEAEILYPLQTFRVDFFKVS